jgi:poly(3-hydroxyalkanoate) depolymerase
MHTSDGRAPKIEIERIGGREIRYAVWTARHRSADRRPILFFNGIGANIELMAPLAEWIDDRDIITFDMPGVGGSPPPRFPYRPWMIARMTMRLLDHLRYDKVDVMGVSWGGGMAQQFAFQHPSRVGKLILAATSPGMFMVPGEIGALSKMANPRRYFDTQFMKDNFRTLYGDEDNVAGSHADRISPPTRVGYAFQLGAMMGWTSMPFLPLMRQKTLVLMGSEDRIVPVVNGKILAGLIPRARLEVVGGGHLFLVSRAAESVPLIKAFLAESDADFEAKAAA